MEKKKKKSENLKNKEEVELLKRIQRGDREAEEKFLKMNQGLVVSIAKKYAFTPDILEDLISEGNIGLLEAIKKFDPKKHTKFSTYAYFWIKRYVMRAIAKESFKVPEKFQKLKTKYRNLAEKLKIEKNRHPDDSEMAELLGLDKQTFLKYKPYFEATRVIPTLHNDQNGEHDLFEFTNFEKGKKQWDQILMDQDILTRIFQRLKEKNKRIPVDTWLKVLKLHYGIENGNQKSYKEIAQELGITRQRVHQIIKTCLKHLHEETKEMKNEGII